MKPKALIARTAGTNCDNEAAYALEQAGAVAQRVHINRLTENPKLLHDYQMLVIPGGFSYGDDIASGRIFATQLMTRLADELREFIADGKPIGGICNGFQVLVKAGLLPGSEGGGDVAAGGGQTCTLTHNTGGRFCDRWVHMTADPSPCIWTKELQEMAAAGETIELPIAHGEGRFVCGSAEVRQRLIDQKQICLRYVKPGGEEVAGGYNPNGSELDIAGICDVTGRIFGLMPHPERHVSAMQHPAWTQRLWQQGQKADAVGPGLKIFTSAVNYVKEGVGAGV